jgi:glutaredoxin
MGIVKIFYKDDCPMCPMAKQLKDTLRERNVPVDDFNVGTTEGLAEATFYRVMALPTILVEDDLENSLGEWRGNVPHIDEVLSAVQSA